MWYIDLASADYRDGETVWVIIRSFFTSEIITVEVSKMALEELLEGFDQNE